MKAEQPRRNETYRAGLRAEAAAALILTAKGYRILARRYKTPHGEIDLVARRGGAVAFVEVKARADLEQALAALTPAMKARIGNAARHYLAAHPQFATFILRFDVIAYVSPLCWRHLDNAWFPPA